MNKLEIETPVGKEVDWKASAKQKQIVLKDKQLTYEDVCNKLFKDRHYYIDEDGDLCSNETGANECPNNATTKHQLECILAKNKLANVAKYLNDGWKPNLEKDYGYSLRYYNNSVIIEFTPVLCVGKIIFKSSELAQQAIKILGEKTVKLALEPLY